MLVLVQKSPTSTNNSTKLMVGFLIGWLSCGNFSLILIKNPYLLLTPQLAMQTNWDHLTWHTSTFARCTNLIGSLHYIASHLISVCSSVVNMRNAIHFGTSSSRFPRGLFQSNWARAPLNITT